MRRHYTVPRRSRAGYLQINPLRFFRVSPVTHANDVLTVTLIKVSAD